MRKLFLLFLLFPVCVFSQSKENKPLEQEVSNIMRAYQAVGISVVVVKDNEVCYSKSFGYNPDYNDTTLRNPIPADGIYWIASVSKTFISTAIMQLVEKKKLKLDDDVNKHLGFRVRNPHYEETPITVRMLLCHRSSINDEHYGWNLDQINPEKGETWRECYNDERPGGKFFYCNLNYSLLGAIIENVTQMRFDEYIDKNICEPLGLQASYNLTKIDSIRLVRTLSFDKKRNKYKQNRSIFNYQYVEDKLATYQPGYSTASLSPAGGLKISAIDLAKWMMVHMNYGTLEGAKIISKDSELQMWQPQGLGREYGLAFSQYSNIVKGENFIGMKGGSHGTNSVFVFNPEKKYGFVVICNGHVPKAGGGNINNEIIRVLYKHYIKNK